MTMKLILCGPPHSGKSCLRYGLKEAIKRQSNEIYPLVITACPDGEGSWFHETSKRNEHDATQLKTQLKGNFTWPKALYFAQWVTMCNEQLVIIDIGGRIDCKNEAICHSATHAVILYRKDNDPNSVTLNSWRNFSKKIGAEVLAEIESTLTDSMEEETNVLKQDIDGVYHGCVSDLQRGDLTIPDRQTIKELAAIVLNKCDAERSKHGSV